MMIDKKLWSNFFYAFLLIVACTTLWQVTRNSKTSPPLQFLPYNSNLSTYSYPVNTLPSNDYQSLIDLHNFSFTMLNLPCNDSSPLLLILVHSDPKNYEIRQTVRETWGKNTAQMKVLFMIGLTNEHLKSKVRKENEVYGDLVQGSFHDAYKNMTYKHVMVFKYAIYHCPQARYILKTDDDVFVNIPLMLNFLKLDLSPFGASRVLFCSLRRDSLVVRSWRSKWRVSFKEYSAKTYPPYCPGWAILYSPDVVFELYREAQRTAYFWIDDVHITGTLAEKVRLNHIDMDKLVLSRTAMNWVLEPSSTFNQTFLYGAPNIANNKIKALWEYVLKHDTHESLLRAIL